MRMNRWLVMIGVAAGLCLGLNQGMAQQDNGGGGGGGGGFRRGNFDPAQMQQRMMDRYKEMLEVSSDDEWKVLQPMVQKVTEARIGAMSGMGRGMFGGRRGGGGNGGDNNGGDQGQRPRGFFGQQPSPEADALQKAIDAKAPKAEIKAALAKYVESRKAKQADLEKAQEELRKLLTARQEAIATLNGLL
jgi:hypothetical protein